MRLLSILFLNLFVLAALASCGIAPSADLSSEATSLPAAGIKTNSEQSTEVQAPPNQTTESQIQAGAETKNNTSTGTTKAPRIYFPEELLTAEEASGMVGQTVTITGVSDEVSETGEVYADYTYDFPDGSTILASLYITQNALVSEEELKKGHDARWAFEESKKYVEPQIVSIPNLGNEAFYLKNNMEVSVLYQDYYILVVFIMDNDDAATLAVNKKIAAHVIDELSLADVSLTGKE